MNRTINTKVKKKRSSLESEGADSGYTSSSSTPSKVQDLSQTTTTASSPILNYPHNNMNQNSIPKKKKGSRRQYQPPRQPDLVYSCPRPLAFPFHNDDHFLPIAEADPRDVARVSPDRSGSIKSSKSSLGSNGTTSMYDQQSSGYRSIHSTNSFSRRSQYSDADSYNSRRSSLLNSIQRDTVRSIRSFFQLPDSLSNKGLSRVQSQSTSYSSTSSVPSYSYSRTAPLERLEIKKGTVQSIKDLFSRKPTPKQTIHVTPPSRQHHAGRVGVTIGQFESSANITDFSRANLMNNNKKSAMPASATRKATDPKQQHSSSVSPQVVPVKPKKKPFTSRAAEFASRALWKKPVSVSPVTPSPPPPPSSKPLPKSPKPTIKTQVKNLSARVLDIPKSWRKPTQQTTTANDTQPPKRSIFSSFKRSDISASAQKKKPTVEEQVPLEPPSKVKKMWKSFKNLVSGKKTSRVGVL